MLPFYRAPGSAATCAASDATAYKKRRPRGSGIAATRAPQDDQDSGKNPPFQNAQDMAHVTHAWGFVKPGGVLVAIMWPAWQAAKTKTAEAFRELVASAAASDVEDIEAGTFEDTAVRTIMLTMHKAGL